MTAATELGPFPLDQVLHGPQAGELAVGIFQLQLALAAAGSRSEDIAGQQGLEILAKPTQSRGRGAAQRRAMEGVPARTTLYRWGCPRWR